MLEFKAKYARSNYLTQLQHLVDYGDKVDVRGRQTLEEMNVMTTITEPWHHCILLPSRRWNPWLALSEALWILAGRDDIAAVQPYNSHIGDYSDDGVHLYGAYGPRLYDQIDPLIERLRKDPSDRRAVLSIWDKHHSIGPGWSELGDLTAVTKDPPCNNLIYFKLRENKLHMTVICRSNDIHYGLYAVNIPTFGILQEYIAARLGVEIGWQQHLSNSLHVYTDDERAVEITDRMLYKGPEDMPIYPQHELAFYPINFEHIYGHKVFAEMCSLVLDGKEPTTFRNDNSELYSVPDFLIFASKFLRQYRDHDWRPDNLRAYDGCSQYEDWIMAGQFFIEQMWHAGKRTSV